MTDSDEPGRSLIKLVDWETAFNEPPETALVAGLLFPGRWTQLAAAAKAGKTTVSLHIATSLALGIDPLSRARIEPVPVLYLDGEMGSRDMTERLRCLGLGPADLPRFHYADDLPKGDILPGGTAIVSTANGVGARLVVLDGLNAFLSGGENEDLPVRELFRHTIFPLKRAGCAVLSTDNTGHAELNRPRGTSVKLDKADAVMTLSRTKTGAALRTTHRRTGSFSDRIGLSLAFTASGGLVLTQETKSWPDGTEGLAAMLDGLQVPLKAGRDAVRDTLRGEGISASNALLGAAMKYRRDNADRSVDSVEDAVGTTAADGSDKLSLTSGDSDADRSGQAGPPEAGRVPVRSTGQSDRSQTENPTDPEIACGSIHQGCWGPP